MRTGALPILTYHAIDTSGAVTSTEPTRFAETIDALIENGFQAVDLERWIAEGRPPVDRGFALAFDDGLRSIVSVADHLARRKVPATVFLVADRIGLDNDWPGQPSHIPVSRLLDRTDLEYLGNLGWRFGSHGCSHLAFTRLHSTKLIAELADSRDRIEQTIGRSCQLVAYPYGSTNVRVCKAAAKIYRAAFSTRLDYSRSSDDLFDIARIDAYYLRSTRSLQRLIDRRWHGELAVRRVFRSFRTSVR
jgi:peptidoglycan/xylan/chitin deacetylase (PgdA/CDA1 family)